jgi:hypothetical protein
MQTRLQGIREISAASWEYGAGSHENQVEQCVQAVPNMTTVYCYAGKPPDPIHPPRTHTPYCLPVLVERRDVRVQRAGDRASGINLGHHLLLAGHAAELVRAVQVVLLPVELRHHECKPASNNVHTANR